MQEHEPREVVPEVVPAPTLPPRRVAISRKTPIVTYAFIGICVAMFLVQLALQLYTHSTLGVSLYILGAKVNELIALGQWWRLIMPIFLHVDFQHILFNCLSLYIWGRQVEMLVGRLRVSVLFLAAGLYGVLFSFLFSQSMSAGASGAIFGLFGCLIYFRLRHKEIFNPVFGIQVLLIVGINLFFGFTQGGIDNFGHIGGLIGGFLASVGMGLYKEKLRPWQIAALCLGVVFYFGALYYGVMRFY